jgi:oxidoreductase
MGFSVSLQDEFVKIDHDYAVNVAKVAKECGCDQFHLVSSRGANKNSINFYLKWKGTVEQHVAEVGFPRVSIYRPGYAI